MLALSAAGWAGEASADTIVFEDVTVIDPVTGAREDQRVVVEGERISSVTSMAEAPAKGGDGRVIDGSGRYLIPGLWDMHVHFLYDRALTDAMADLFLRYGITSVRDTGGNLERVIAVRERLEAAPAPAPRVFLSGPLLDGEFVVYDGGDPGRPPLGTSVPSVEDAHREVQRLRDAGADFIKIYELVAPPVFLALVDAARQHGLPVAAHVPLAMTADEAGPLVDSMEHLRNVELACAGNWRELHAARRALMAGFEEGRGYDLRAEMHAEQRLPAIAGYDAERCDQVLSALTGTIQVPTLRLNAFEVSPPYRRDDWEAALEDLPIGVARDWLRQGRERQAQENTEDTTFADWSLFLVGRMNEHGVPVGAGTDTPIDLAIPGYSLHTELALLVEAGLTPVEALYAATVMPARFFGLEEQMGAIRPGMAADLVLLGANPLEDIENTRRIEGVMTRGRWLVEQPRSDHR